MTGKDRDRQEGWAKERLGGGCRRGGRKRRTRETPGGMAFETENEQVTENGNPTKDFLVGPLFLKGHSLINQSAFTWPIPPTQLSRKFRFSCY